MTSNSNDPFELLKATAGQNPACTPIGTPVDGELISPAPKGAPPAMRRHKDYGDAAATWPYLDASGAVLGYVARFNKAGGEKVVLPQTFRRGARGDHWRWKGWPEPKRLRSLHPGSGHTLG